MRSRQGLRLPEGETLQLAAGDVVIMGIHVLLRGSARAGWVPLRGWRSGNHHDRITSEEFLAQLAPATRPIYARLRGQLTESGRPARFSKCQHRPPGDTAMTQLGVDLKNNRTQKPGLYQTNDPAQNVLTLSVSNYTSQDVIVSVGTGRLRLLFGALLTPAEVQAIQVNAPGWQATATTLAHGVALDLTPSQDVPLANNTSLTFAVTVPAVSAKPTSGNLTVEYTGLKGIADDEVVLRLFVLTPPGGQAQPPLSAGWVGGMEPVVYVTPSNQSTLITSALGVVLSNNNATAPLVTPGQSGTQPPVFKLSFLTIPRPDPSDPLPNPGLNALTYDDLAKDIGVRVAGDHRDNWLINPGYGTSNQALEWELSPQTPEILGPGAAVELFIDNIRTTLPPFATALYIQYANIPGYADGFFVLHPQKAEPQPGVLSFYAKSANINLGEPARLSWTTFAVTSVQLSYAEGNKTLVKSSDNGEIALQQRDYELTPTTTTTYTLTAYAASGECKQQQVTVTVNALAIDMDIQPTSLLQGSTAQLTWNVTGSDYSYCSLDPGDIHLPLSGTRPLTVNVTTTYTITAYNSKKSPPNEIAQRTVTAVKSNYNPNHW